VTADVEAFATVMGIEDGCSGQSPTPLLYVADLSSISQGLELADTARTFEKWLNKAKRHIQRKSP
jgi:hypothetical protein